jgi:predicted lipoprotein with Yx(FWY)xxD motif
LVPIRAELSGSTLPPSRCYEGGDVVRNRWWAVQGLAAAALLLAACGTSSAPVSSGKSSPAASAAAKAAAAQSAAAAAVGIKTMSTSKGTVLANTAGMTVYWFAMDTSTASVCLAACLTIWPPVVLTAVPVPGSLPKGFGTITRPTGQTQLTFDGHPLYTYAGDTSAGQITGNGVDANGGLWWAMTPAGTQIGSSSSSGGSGAGSGGGSTGGSGGSSGGGGGTW